MAGTAPVVLAVVSWKSHYIGGGAVCASVNLEIIDVKDVLRFSFMSFFHIFERFKIFECFYYLKTLVQM